MKIIDITYLILKDWEKDENQIKILQKIYLSIKEIDPEFRYNIEFDKFIDDINNKILKEL